MATRPVLGAMVARSLAVLLAAGCVARARPVPADPGVTFAAHQSHRGLVIDRMVHGAPGAAVAEGWWHRSDEPTVVLREQGDTEGLWLEAPGEVAVRRGTAATAPVSERVVSTWDDGSIRLTLRPAAGAVLRSDVFTRVDSGAGPSTLTRNARSSAGVRGVYQAALRTPDGTPAGWLRVRVGLLQPAPVMYEGVLPPEVDEGLATAAAEALGSEIAWIEEHVLGSSRAPEWRP